MQGFEQLSKAFLEQFQRAHFPEEPAALYGPATYFLGVGGKRIRPVMCLMGNQLFDEIRPDAWHLANAVELFHNFTLIHDDIMDKAPLRRGMQTVHVKYGEPTALLSGDVMLVFAYEYINRIGSSFLQKIIQVFNRAARMVCEGQQLDMVFEQEAQVSFGEYLRMIELKTSVLLAASLQMGAIVGGAGEGNQRHLYEFGKNLGLAFQVQDDYLDAFGDPAKFGKKVGGDILANKKTFLLIRALEHAGPVDGAEIRELLSQQAPDKVERMLTLFKRAGVDQWACELKERFAASALQHLDDIAVLSSRKGPLRELSQFMLHRDH